VREALLGVKGGELAKKTEARSLASVCEDVHRPLAGGALASARPSCTALALSVTMDQLVREGAALKLRHEEVVADLTARLAKMESEIPEESRRIPDFVTAFDCKVHFTEDHRVTACGWFWAEAGARAYKGKPPKTAKTPGWCVRCAAKWLKANASTVV